QFLMGLNEKYSAIRGQIMLMQPLPIVKKAYSLLCEEEKQQGLSNSHSSKKPLLCTYCDGTPHIVDKCYYLIGFPVGRKFHRKDVQPPNRTHKFTVNQIGTKSSQTPIKTVQTSDLSHQFTPEELSQIKVFFRNSKNYPRANYTSIYTPFCSSSTLQNFNSMN
ncbi:hypothetical protein CICLE_v10003204mg, partial [Citrus x clementina]